MTRLRATVQSKHVVERCGQESLLRSLGIFLFVLLLPVGGVDALPPRCWSMFGYNVRRHRGVSVAGGGVTTAVVGLALSLSSREGRDV
ncbi:MAG: hypothetical protein ABR609_00720 [Acidimicrobiia bacterium]